MEQPDELDTAAVLAHIDALSDRLTRLQRQAAHLKEQMVGQQALIAELQAQLIALDLIADEPPNTTILPEDT